jgi:RNA polymerase sigma-70 factor (ECF subfamily)
MAVYSPNTLRQTDIEDLFRYNYRPLCMYALHYLQDTDLVEDCAQ